MGNLHRKSLGIVLRMVHDVGDLIVAAAFSCSRKVEERRIKLGTAPPVERYTLLPISFLLTRIHHG